MFEFSADKYVKLQMKVGMVKCYVPLLFPALLLT